MTLKDLLQRRKSAVLERWRMLIFRTYPPRTAVLLQRDDDEFHNPVGHAIVRETESIYDALVAASPHAPMTASFSETVKIRAVQDFSPSQAVAFVFLLKTAIREQVLPELDRNGLTADLLALESRIDDLALRTFDAYLQCREKIYDIRVNEIKNRTFQLLHRRGAAEVGSPASRREVATGGTET